MGNRATMQTLFATTLILVSHCYGQDASKPKTLVGDPQSDAFIDEVLKNLRQMIIDNGWDPIDLPDLETGFSDTILGITWHGDAWVFTKLCSKLKIYFIF